jgi:uracil-DNA glycosylase family 4
LPETKISQVHGTVIPIDFHGLKTKVIPMYHPAAGLRRGTILTILKSDFLKIKEEL